MMMHLRMLVVLLLASVGTASAECAWLLWGRAPDGTWDVMDAFAKDEQGGPSNACYFWVQGYRKNLKEEGWRYQCFPDTVDPREPKGR